MDNINVASDNGAEPQDVEMVQVARDLLQAILDYLSTCPAGQVYPLLRRIETELQEPVKHET